MTVTDKGLRLGAGWVLLIGQIVTVFILMIFHKGFTFEEGVTAFALISPMFLTYTIPFVKYVRRTREERVNTSKPQSTSWVFIVYLLSSVLVLALILAVAFKAFNVISSFFYFEVILLIIELAIGVYLGIVLDSFYE